MLRLKKHFEEKNYLPPVLVTSSYVPVKDSSVMKPPFNNNVENKQLGFLILPRSKIFK
jgi:hypothetical protein